MGNFFFIFGKILKTMFGFRKVLRKEKKNIKENDFFIFSFSRENTKENQTLLKLVRNL